METKADISKTQRLLKLFETVRDERDPIWVSQFCDLAAVAPLEIADPQILQGPDRFPYFNLKVPAPNGGFSGAAICDIVEHVTETGVGVVLTAGKAEPEWVFNLGALVNFRETGKFMSSEPFDFPPPSQPPPENPQEGSGEVKVFVANPGTKILPPYLRRHLSTFLKNVLKVENPGVLLLRDERLRSPSSLVFTVFQDHFSSPEVYKNAIRSLHWFLPHHYIVGGLPQNAIPRAQYFPLVTGE